MMSSHWEDGPFPIVSDKSALDCPICVFPLTIPVYQCENGHITCSSCLDRLKKPQCPTCSCSNPSSVRNRAIEQVLESVTAFCAYEPKGYTSGRLTYAAKRLHEQTCAYAPYPCPYFKNCKFMGSPAQLHTHIQKAHSPSCVEFRPGSEFYYPKEVKFVFFLDVNATIFVLRTKTMEIYSVQDPKVGYEEPPKFPFSVFVKTESHSYVFEPTTVRCGCADDADWNVEVTDNNRSNEAVILDLIFEDCDKIYVQLVDRSDDAMILG